MSNEDVIAKWKARSAREVELPSGTNVTIRLTTVADEIKAGAFAGPVLEFAHKLKSEGLAEVATKADKDSEIDEQWEDFRASLVAACVTQIEGQDVTLSFDDAKGIPKDDFEELFLYIWRVKSLPKAGD